MCLYGHLLTDKTVDHIHSGASPHSWCFVKYFLHVPPAVGLILQLLCSPIGNWNFQKKRKNIANERTPQTVHHLFWTMFNRWLSVLRIWTDKPIHTYCISDVATNGDAQMNEWRKEKDVFLSLSVNVMFFSQRKTDSPLQLQLQNDPKNTLFCNILLIVI